MFVGLPISIFLLQTENTLMKDSVLSNCWIFVTSVFKKKKKKEPPFKRLFIYDSLYRLLSFLNYFPIFFSELS